MPPRRSPALEALASDLVGDGGTPHLFFVSDAGVVTTVTLSFRTAHHAWRKIPRTRQSALEGRHVGVICSTEPRSDTDSRLVTIDDSHLLPAAVRAA